jgi:hypothetical protein
MGRLRHWTNRKWSLTTRCAPGVSMSGATFPQSNRNRAGVLFTRADSTRGKTIWLTFMQATSIPKPGILRRTGSLSSRFGQTRYKAGESLNGRPVYRGRSSILVS